VNLPPVIIGVGEVVWDLLDGGPQLGGAPANFAFHARALGARAYVVSRVGDDSLGHDVMRRFREKSVSAELMQVDVARPTGTVAVTLQEDGVPHFNIREDVAWDWLEETATARQMIGRADAVCFGSLAQRCAAARAAIQQLMAVASPDTLRIFDINLRQPYYSREIIEQSLKLANVLKLNDKELPVLGDLFQIDGPARTQIEQLAARFSLRLVVLTRGAHGSLIFHHGRWSEQLPQAVQVVDTVGAGDAFTAALTMGLLNRMDLDEVHAGAAAVARYVCSRAGATPPLPEALRGLFSSARSAPWMEAPAGHGAAGPQLKRMEDLN
jgi:fructokinase